MKIENWKMKIKSLTQGLFYSLRYGAYLVRLGIYKLKPRFLNQKSKILNLKSLFVHRKSKRLRTAGIAACLLLVILAPAIYLSLRSAKSVHAWWDERYLYRQPVTISYSAAETLSDYQVRVTVNTSTLISAGKMKTDCGDIRFYEENYGERSYWVEDSTCNTTTTYVWVKVGKIEKGGKTIWLYYGNNNGAAQSNIDNTFIYGEDFTSLTSGKMTYSADHTKSVSSGVLSISSTATGWANSYLNYTISPSTTVKVDAKIRSNAVADTNWHASFLRDTVSGNSERVGLLDPNYAGTDFGVQKLLATVGTYPQTMISSAGSSTWYKVEHTKSSSTTLGLTTFSDAWSQLATYSTTESGWSSTSWYWSFWTYETESRSYDWVFVRQYAATEPTAAVGSEQQSKGPVVFLTFDEGTGEIAHNEMGPQITPNPVLFLKFDEKTSGSTAANCSDVIDSGPRHHISTCYSPIAYTENPIGGALNFGASDYIYITDGNVTTATDNWTMSTWINWTGDTAEDQWIIFNGYSYGVYLKDSDSNQIHFSIGAADIDTNTALTPGSWYHLTMLRRNGIFYGYLNGEEFNSGNTTTPSTPGSVEGIEFPIATSIGNNLLNGALDQIKVWENALSPAQVYAEYSETNAYFQPSGATGPTWKNYAESPNHPKTLSFDGVNDYLNIPDQNVAVNTVSFWVKPNSTTESIVDLDGGTHTITLSSGSLTATGWTNPKYYVNGIEARVVTAGVWQLITITTASQFTAADIDIGRVSSTYFTGETDNFKIYNYARSADQIKLDYNNPCPGGCQAKLGSQITAEGMPTPGGYWKFDDGSGQVAVDSSPNGNDGTLGSSSASDANDPTWTRGGQASGALGFDGTNDYVVVSNESNFDFERTDSFSISAWVYYTDTGSPSMIFSKMADSAPYTGYEFWVSTDNKLSVYIINTNATNAIYVNGQTSIKDVGWHHAAMTYNGTSSASGVKIYLDGKQETLTTTYDNLNASILNNISPNIGARNSAAHYFTGKIDELKVYNTTLTQEQIMLDYSNKKPVLELGMEEGSGEVVHNSQGTTIAPNPVGWWKMDEATSGTCTGTGTVLDRGSGGNNGTCYLITPSYLVGKIGGAIDFGGSTYVYTSQNPTTAVDNWTMSAWLNWDGDLTFNQFVLNNGGGYYMYLKDTDSNQLHLYNGTDIDTNTTVTAGIWTHLVMLRRNGVLYGYKDGVQIYSGDTTTPTTPTCYEGQCFFIGDQVDGKIDHVKVWSSALTAAQVYNEYAETNAYFQPSGATGPTWKNYVESPDHPKAISFDGSNDYLNLPDQDLPVNTVSFWVKPNSTTESIVDLDGGTHTVTFSSGSLTATGWSSPTYYVNGVQGRAVTAGVWQMVTLTTATQFTAADIDIGRVSSTYFTGEVDNFKIYNYSRSADEIKLDYNNPCPGGCGLKLGAQITADGMPAPKGYWKFDDGAGQVAKDSSPNGYDGTLGASGASGSDDPTWTESGQASGALTFDGGDFVDTNQDTPFDFGTGNFAVSLWAKRVETSYFGSYVDLVSKEGPAPSYGGFYLGFDALNQINFAIWIDASNQLGFTATQDITDDSWHHYFCQRTSSTNMDCYLDGVELAGSITSVGTANANSTTDVFIGSDKGAGNFFPGTIDEVKIYGTSLTQEQILLDYNNKKPLLEFAMNENAGEIAYSAQGTTIPKNPIGWWKLDEATSGNCTGTVYDTGSGGNNGTCQNTVPYGTGKIGGDLDFDGSLDYVSIADSSTLDFADGQSFSISFWFNRDTATTDDTVIAKKNTQDNTTAGYVVWIDDATDDIRLVVSDGDSANLHTVDSVSAFSSTGWHHAVVVYDDSSATGSNIYIDGADNTQANTTSGTFTSIGDLSNSVVLAIGAESDAGNPFDGKLDHVKIWNSALTGAQAYAEYAETNAYFMNMDAATDWVVSPNGRALDFDGSNDYLNIPDQDVPVNTVSFWVKPNSTTESIVDLDGGTHTVTFSSGSLTATGWSSPTYYVNGVQGRAVTAGVWQMVTLTTATQFTAADIDIGRVSSTYFTGEVDNFKIYNYARSASEVKADYNNGAVQYR